MNLTQNEMKILIAIDQSEFGDELGDPTYMWSVKDRSRLRRYELGATVSKLVRKGLVTVAGEGVLNSIGMTAAGASLYVAACNGHICKRVRS